MTVQRRSKQPLPSTDADAEPAVPAESLPPPPDGDVPSSAGAAPLSPEPPAHTVESLRAWMMSDASHIEGVPEDAVMLGREGLFRVLDTFDIVTARPLEVGFVDCQEQVKTMLAEFDLSLSSGHTLGLGDLRKLREDVRTLKARTL